MCDQSYFAAISRSDILRIPGTLRSDASSRSTNSSKLRPTLGRLFVAVLLLTAAALAHPARGIVIDKKGRVCFLGPAFRVCRIEPDAEPDGKLTRTRTGGVSPHHLAIDSVGNLYFEGWLPTQLSRLAPSGELTRAYPPEGKKKGNAYLGGGVQCPFLVDSKGAIYFVETRAEDFGRITNLQFYSHKDFIEHIEEITQFVPLIGTNWGNLRKIFHNHVLVRIFVKSVEKFNNPNTIIKSTKINFLFNILKSFRFFNVI